MTDLQQRIMSAVREALGPDRLESAIVYLDRDLKRAGERVPVGDVVVHVPWDSHLVFADLEPAANWGHACSYLTIRIDRCEVAEFEAHMPPFLKTEESHFCLLWRGPLAPEWAVVKGPCE